MSVATPGHESNSSLTIKPAINGEEPSDPLPVWHTKSDGKLWEINDPALGQGYLRVTFPPSSVPVRLWYVITNVVRYIVKGEVRL